MLFFGWGNSNKQWLLSDGKMILVTWSYFHIFWLFRFSWEQKWHLLSDLRSEDQYISRATAIALTGNEKINIPFIDRYGWAVVIGLIICLNLFA